MPQITASTSERAYYAVAIIKNKDTLFALSDTGKRAIKKNFMYEDAEIKKAYNSRR
jgi:hypothetical protein